MARRAALFDMDRTLVRTDTATLFVRYEHDIGVASLSDVARVAFWLLQYSFGVIDAEKAAKLATARYADKPERWLIQRCERWFPQYVLPHVADEGRRRIAQHLGDGDVVAVVTSATPYAARPLCREVGVEHLVCTELEVSDGRLTGKLLDPMCYGPGKITLAEKLGERLGFSLDDATFYSDSITDLPLLERVGQPVVINPDTRLRSVARARDWPIEAW